MKKTYIFGIAVFAFLLVSSFALFLGCKTETETSAPQVVVERVEIRLNGATVTEETIDAAKGATLNFVARVHGTNNPANTVIWTINGGNEDTTLIDGVLQIADDEADDEEITIVVTSTVDDTKESWVTVKVLPDAPGLPVVHSVTITVTNNVESVAQGTQLQFNATVNASDNAVKTVIWDIASADHAGTSISQSGLLTVGTHEPQTSITVRATPAQPGFAGLAQTRTVAITLTPIVSSVTITTMAASVEQGKTLQFDATVDAANGAANTVIWSIISTGNSSGTSISSTTGLLTVAVNEAANITVKATPAQPGFEYAAQTKTVTVIPVIVLPEGVMYQIYKAGILDPRFSDSAWNDNAVANGYTLTQNNVGRGGALGIRLHRQGDSWGRGMSINANAADTVDWSTVDALSFWIRATADDVRLSAGFLDDAGFGNDPLNVEYKGETNEGILVHTAWQRIVIPLPREFNENRRQVFKVFIAEQGSAAAPNIYIDDITLISASSVFNVVIPPLVWVNLESATPIASIISEPFKVAYTVNVSGANRTVSLFNEGVQFANWFDLTYDLTGNAEISGADLTAAGSFTLRIAFDGTIRSNTLNGRITTGYSTDYFSENFDTALCSFYDKFEGTSLDLTKWGYQNGWGNGGWGNNEAQYYHHDNVIVSGGVLRLQARKESRGAQEYTSGKLVTANGHSPPNAPEGSNGLKFGQTYGRFEAKIRMTKAEPGMWPAFWMMPVASVYGGWPRSGEIDIMEMVGRRPNRASGTAHYRAPHGHHYLGSEHRFEDGSDFTQWHVYGVVWTSTEFRFLIDGKQYRRIPFTDFNFGFYDTTNPPSPISGPFNRDFHLILNLAVGGTFDPGYLPADSALPIELEIDWVRVYTLENDPWVILGEVPRNLVTNHNN